MDGRRTDGVLIMKRRIRWFLKMIQDMILKVWPYDKVTDEMIYGWIKEGDYRVLWDMVSNNSISHDEFTRAFELCSKHYYDTNPEY